MSEKDSILVIGGGISGMTTAIEAAEAGTKVFLVERDFWLGGRVAASNRYFPKLCPPFCGLEINFRRIRQNPNITVYTGAQVEELKGIEGDFEAVIKLEPRYINEKCTACGDCVDACAVERADTFNQSGKTKAIYIPHAMAFPARYAVDTSVCDAGSLKEAAEKCRYDAFDLDAKPETITLNVGSVVVATGWKPYDATKLEHLGFGRFPNVITNVMMERLASPGGPTAGKLVRPSDGEPVKSIAFVQCAGSRDENHLPYCSTVCCMASLKQATYLEEASPETEITIFYIDIRAPGRYEDFFRKIQDQGKVNLIKGKVANITEDPNSKNLVVEAEDIAGGSKVRKEVDMVVLATGIEPQNKLLPFQVATDEYGFLLSAGQTAGVHGAGCAKKPVAVAGSVRDATGAALLAMGRGGQ